MTSSDDIRLFKALGEPTKNAILRELSGTVLCACELPARIGRTQSNTSMHLAKLAEWGIVSSRKEGRKVIYSLADARVARLLRVAGGRKAAGPRTASGRKVPA